MKERQRFELAIARYKDLCDQLRRWEASQVARGIPAAKVRKDMRRLLADFNLFPLHEAMFALERQASAAAFETFEREIAHFESAIEQLQRRLSADGIPIEG